MEVGSKSKIEYLMHCCDDIRSSEEPMKQHSILEFNYPSEKAIRTKPINLIPSDDILFSAEYYKKLGEVSPVPLNNVFVYPNGMLLKGMKLVPEQFNIQPNLRGYFASSLKTYSTLLKSKRKEKFKNAVWVTNSNSVNFFHWFFDVLQKIEYLSKLPLLDGKHKEIIFIVPSNHDKSFIRETLKAFELNVYFQKKNEILFVESLCLIPNLSPTGNYRKEVIQKLRVNLKNHFRFTNTGFEKVYITRKNASKRKIINEDQLIPILKKHGFHIADMDTLCFEKQIETVMNAKVLASLHGAGLSHMIWMTDHADVLEIRAKNDSHNNCYYSLASDLDYRYWYLLADKNDQSKSTQEADFIVDTLELDTVLRKMLTQ